MGQPFDEQSAAKASQSLKAGRKVLLTLMKHPTHIAGARKVLEALGPRKTLIIDDEADQASLNTRVKTGSQSAIYREILRLRAAAGTYLYVQYTATPFAPLLLEPTDALSPEFLVQLEPGSGYVGGRTYFVDRRNDLARPIDLVEAQLETLDGLPAGLKQALGSFFVAAALIKHLNLKRPPVSMLVHPSHLRHVHRSYFGVIDAAIDDWGTRLSRPASDPGREADVALFAESFEDFRTSTRVSFDDLVPDLVDVVRDARRWLVNSDGQALEVDWTQGNVHVLVGGSILDRGFVVDGLTTTYLTRGETGTGQADTIEQRARYFGYKRDYLDLCRVYTPTAVADTFQALVHTEGAMRESLLDHIESGGALSSWARDSGFELPANVRPTREIVVRAIARSRVAGEFHAMRSPSTDPADAQRNAHLVDATFAWHDAEHQDFGRNARYQVLRGAAPSSVLDLLRRWRPGGSGQPWAGLRFTTYLENRIAAGLLPNFTVMMLTKPGTDGEPRERTWATPETGMGALLQGADAKTGYPGDRALLPADLPQLQIHRIRPHGVKGIDELLALALYVPHADGYPDGIVHAR
ncbi:Z1 domain-containing protein [Promicromonospora soli]